MPIYVYECPVCFRVKEVLGYSNFFIDGDLCIDSCIWHEYPKDHARFDMLGVFKTEKEALAMVEKIKSVVTQEIGGC